MLFTTTKSIVVLKSSFRPFTIIRTKVTLPELPYEYNALEPYIDAEIMKIHHSKHHKAYVEGYNQAEERLEHAFRSNDLTQQITLQSVLKFNGGGHINHSLFWENLAPKGKGNLTNDELHDAINKEFGTFNEFITKFNVAAASVQGSGWAWLGYNKSNKHLEIATTFNQDPLLHLIPLLGVDVWEHAYYLQYKNARTDYLKNIWEVINWETASKRYSKAQSK